MMPAAPAGYAVIPGECLLQCPTQHLAEQDVHFLDPCRHCRGDNQARIAEGGIRPPSPPSRPAVAQPRARARKQALDYVLASA